MRYDGLKRMVFMYDPDRGVMTYTYDSASNLTETLEVMRMPSLHRITGYPHDAAWAVAILPNASRSI